MDLWRASPNELQDIMTEAGLRRACLVTDPDSGALSASHSALEPVRAAVLADERDYHAHEGGVRFWHYDTALGHRGRVIIDHLIDSGWADR